MYQITIKTSEKAIRDTLLTEVIQFSQKKKSAYDQIALNSCGQFKICLGTSTSINLVKYLTKVIRICICTYYDYCKPLLLGAYCLKGMCMYICMCVRMCTIVSMICLSIIFLIL